MSLAPSARPTSSVEVRERSTAGLAVARRGEARAEGHRRRRGHRLESVRSHESAAGENAPRIAKPRRGNTLAGRGPGAIACPYGLPRPRSTHPWSSCTIGTAPTCWRARTAHRQPPAGRRDQPSDRRHGGRGAHSPGTSRRTHRAKRAALGRSGVARPACCTGRCAGCGWTGGCDRCSGYQRGW